jgi:hypothetical protein
MQKTQSRRGHNTGRTPRGHAQNNAHVHDTCQSYMYHPGVEPNDFKSTEKWRLTYPSKSCGTSGLAKLHSMATQYATSPCKCFCAMESVLPK